MLAYSPTSVDFGQQVNGITVDTTFDLWNAGDGTLNYYVYVNALCPWISVTPESGFSQGEVDEITVEINTAGMEPGPYSCDVLIWFNGSESVFTVTVDVVQAEPILAYSPTEYDLGDVLENDLATFTLQIWNAGNGTMYYNFDEGCTWVITDPWSGSSGGEVDEITVNCFTSPLTLGPHQCDVTINSSAGPGTFRVYVNVVPRP